LPFAILIRAYLMVYFV